MMKYYLDTEFDEAQGRINLISIGIVSADGKRRFYAENADYQPDDRTSQWLKDNVLPKLQYWGKSAEEVIAVIIENAEEKNTMGGLITIAEMKGALLLFFEDETPEFWGYYADYDWVVFMWIFGTMMDKPENFPYYCRDLKQKMDEAGLDSAWKDRHCPDPENEHNALADAEWNRKLDMAIEAHENRELAKYLQ